MRNASSRSVILAPFNSTQSDQKYAEIKSEFKKMLMPRRIIRFAPKVKEIDRQYELNNNGELDNGVYHQDGEDGGVCNESK